VRQASQRLEGDARRRGVEQVHSTILQRRQEADTRRSQEATDVFERSIPGPGGEEPPQVLTLDFLRKYLRYCRRFTPILSEAAQVEVAERYVDMRMRFQSGYADQSNPESTKKPRLAVTTRTLEALIRLATAHAKLKLRKDEVLPEDVQEAYKLMMAAREEEVPPAPAAGDEDDDQGPGDGADGDDAAAGREVAPSPNASRKRTRDEAFGAPISSGRLKALVTLVSRTFARRQVQVMSRGELLEGVNAGLVEGENLFADAEFDAGLTEMEIKNKVMVAHESGEVVHVG